MNNTVKTLSNGDFEVRPLEEAEEFEKKRNYTYEWNGVAPSVNQQYQVKHEWDEWKPIE